MSTLQVPDNITALLSDPSLFSINGEITTKEILKRFQDRQGQFQMGDMGEVYNRQDSMTRPPARRIETDPSLWQGETSVRHIQEPPMPPPGYGNSNPSTPPKSWRGPDDSGHPSPYRDDFDRMDRDLEDAP